MNLDGIVADLHLNRGMVAVRTENYGYAIFEITDTHEIFKGDRVVWDEDARQLVNITQNRRHGAMVQNYGVSESQLNAQLLRV